MGLIRRWFGKGTPGKGPRRGKYPWQQEPSIYMSLRDRPTAGEAGGRPADLPDKDRVTSATRLPWAAGALDGVFSHHAGGGPGEGDIEALLAAVRAFGQTASDADKFRIYERVRDKGALGLVDAFIQALREVKGTRLDRLHALARSFATEAPDREPVKFGIALLGAFRLPEDLEVYRVLGRHDEFTLFAAVALANTLEDPEPELWALAREVEGWGRIHLVERLAGTKNPDIRDWMLREGYRNSIMTEYLAHTCAVTGGLREALERTDPDDGLLTAAADLLEALVVGGPAEGMDDYADGAEAAELYLRHLGPRGRGLRHFLAVETIRGFLEEEKADWTDRSGRGWTPERREDLLRLCADFRRRPGWPAEVAEGLGSDDPVVFWQAARAADILGIDAWETYWKRLKQAPLEPGRWYAVVSKAGADRLAAACAFAEESLPLEAIAAGPADELGLGPAWRAHSCLDLVLQALGPHPGLGVRLVETGLSSPVTRNRNIAAGVLEAWGRDRWPAAVEPLLRKAIEEEPNPDLRERLRRAYSGPPHPTALSQGKKLA
ncbi:MAG: hypothetical protein KA419_17155 [Acidobacteria bacterium]|nr:hypothetical protein [Acidobacteriota bacterium]